MTRETVIESDEASVVQAGFVAGCVDAEGVRLWRELFEAHGLGPEAEYQVDSAGRV